MPSTWAESPPAMVATENGSGAGGSGGRPVRASYVPPHLRNRPQEALARAEELEKSAEAKRALRQANLAPDRPDASFFKTLDSSIKRNTAVIKKLKQINEEQREGLLEELRVVNLSKFVSEAVTAILDAKLKSSDINAAVQVCSLLYQGYKDSAPTLLAGLLKVFFPAKGDEIDGDRNSRTMKKRSTLRLLVELYFCGVFEDGSVFLSIIKDLMSSEHLKDRETTQTNLTLLVSFARQGRDLLGLYLNGQDGPEELYKELSVTTDQKKHLGKLFQSFLDAVVELLQTEHGALRQLELENARMLNAEGERSEENAAAYEKLRKSYEHLFRNISSLAEAMDTQPPVTPEDGHATHVTTGDDGASKVAGKEPASPKPIWDDEDTRPFYESLPDLRAFVPAVLLGESEPKGVAEASQKAADQVEPEQTTGLVAETLDVILETETQTLETLPTGIDDKSASSATEKPKDKDKDDKDRTWDPEKEKLKEKGKDGEKQLDKETEKVRGAEGASLDSLLQRLPGCVSQDLIDQLTVDFCYLNSKSSRKKLVRTLFNVPRSSLELIPYYSRMIATLSTCMKDVAPMILQLLEEEFNFLMNKEDQMNIETKIRNIRFFLELAKFKVASPGLVFSCLKSCLDFQSCRLNEGIHTVPSRNGKNKSKWTRQVGSKSGGTASTTPTTSVNSSIVTPLKNLTIGLSSPPSFPLGSPPSSPPLSNVLFRYVEKSFDKIRTVRDGFVLNHQDAWPVIVEVLQLYSQKLQIDLNNFNIIPFEVDIIKSNLVCISLKRENVKHGLESQLHTCRETVADLIGENEGLKKEKEILGDKRRKDGKEMDLIEARFASFEGKMLELKETIASQQETMASQQETMASLKETMASQNETIQDLVSNAQLQYKTRRRIILEKARNKLVSTLQNERKNCTWEEYVQKLSQVEKLKSGASEGMLEEMGSGMYSLNKDVHTEGPIYEMAHAVNNVVPPERKKVWQDLFSYVYEGQHPEDVEFGPN